MWANQGPMHCITPLGSLNSKKSDLGKVPCWKNPDGTGKIESLSLMMKCENRRTIAPRNRVAVTHIRHFDWSALGVGLLSTNRSWS